MKKNIGITDKGVRIAAGVVIVGLGIYFQSWWGVLGLPLLLTGWMNMCPLYTIIGISTGKDEEQTSCAIEPTSEKKAVETEEVKTVETTEKPL